MSKDKIHIVAHKGCMDGAVSAWILDTAFSRYGLMFETEVHMINPGIPPDLDPTGKSIIFVDCVIAPEAMRMWESLAREIAVLDHHKSNIEEHKAAGLVWPQSESCARIDKSGAQLALSYAIEMCQVPMRPAQFMSWIAHTTAQYDLNLFDRQGAREINAALFGRVPLISWEVSKAALDELADSFIDFEANGRLEAFEMHLFTEGAILLREHRRQVEYFTSRAAITHLVAPDGQDHIVPVVQSPVFPGMNELIGGLAVGYPFAIGWCVEAGTSDLIAHVSIRANRDSPLAAKGEALAFAKALGGGGHEFSCGARLPLRTWVDILEGGPRPFAGPANEPLSISAMVQRAHATALSRGWHGRHLEVVGHLSDARESTASMVTLTRMIHEVESERFGALMALLGTEIAEAMEAYRERGLESWLDPVSGKPEGVPAELADVLIRLGDICGFYNINLEATTLDKMAYNESRPHRHGGKKL